MDGTDMHQNYNNPLEFLTEFSHKTHKHTTAAARKDSIVINQQLKPNLASCV